MNLFKIKKDGLEIYIKNMARRLQKQLKKKVKSFYQIQLYLSVKILFQSNKLKKKNKK